MGRGRGPSGGEAKIDAFRARPHLKLVLASFLGYRSVVFQAALEWRNVSPMMLMMLAGWL